MNKYLKNIIERPPNLNTPLDEALAALWTLDTMTTRKSIISNKAAKELERLRKIEKAARECVFHRKPDSHRKLADALEEE